jgi:hypothetical protein
MGTNGADMRIERGYGRVAPHLKYQIDPNALAVKGPERSSHDSSL